MGFLPNNIKAPSEGGGGSGNYLRFTQGENKFRIIGASDDKPTPGFIHGTLGWTEEDGKKRPIRWAEGTQAPMQFADKPRNFYAFVVYNYNESKVQILELTQVKLQAELLQLAQDEDWGDCRKYDISVVRNGEGLDTTYAMNPKPIKKMDEDIRAIAKAELKRINLPALFNGGDPFAEFTPPAAEVDEDGAPF
tara:strand:- start:308 stop:886 length:579 start_codon:yes stop_codon:yes gene_type:complete